MILEGNQRGGARDLALHLMSPENEHAEIHEIRGFVSDGLLGAFRESYAMSLGTKCKQHLYSLSLNPPPNEKAAVQDFEQAVAQVEKKLGLENQPRAIVFHEKHGRRHAHAVWSRIDTQHMRAVQLSYTKRKLQEISRDLYIQHGWTMPKGFLDQQATNPLNYTLAQWQQAKRRGKDPKHIKAALQHSWATSDTQQALSAALLERGYYLAKGDRRSFVAIDSFGEVYALPKWLGLKTKAVKAKIGNPDQLPRVAEARQHIAGRMAGHLKTLQKEQDNAIAKRQQQIVDQIQAMTKTHREERANLRQSLETRQAQLIKMHQRQLKTGWQGVWQRITGQRRKIKTRIQQATYHRLKQDQTAKDQLIFHQLQARYRLERRIERLKHYQTVYGRSLIHDIERYREIQRGTCGPFRDRQTLHRHTPSHYRPKR